MCFFFFSLKEIDTFIQQGALHLSEVTFLMLQKIYFSNKLTFHSI